MLAGSARTICAMPAVQPVEMAVDGQVVVLLFCEIDARIDHDIVSVYTHCLCVFSPFQQEGADLFLLCREGRDEGNEGISRGSRLNVETPAWKGLLAATPATSPSCTGWQRHQCRPGITSAAFHFTNN